MVDPLEHHHKSRYFGAERIGTFLGITASWIMKYYIHNSTWSAAGENFDVWALYNDRNVAKTSLNRVKWHLAQKIPPQTRFSPLFFRPVR